MMGPPEIRRTILERLSIFPLVNRSMLGLSMNYVSAKEIASALGELLEEGIVKEKSYFLYRRQSPVFFLAENEDLVDAFLERQKK